MSASKQHYPAVSSSRALAAYFLGTILFLYAFVQRVSPSVMTSELMRDFGADAATIGALSSMYFYTYAAIQIPVGVLMDRYGPRKLLAYSAIVSAIASVCFALSPNVLTASISRAFIGASVAFAFVGTLSIASQFFKPARFTMLAGILLGVGMLGAMLGQAPLRLMVESISWRNSFYVLGVWALLMSVLAWFVVPRRSKDDNTASVEKGSLVVWPVFGNVQTWLCGVVGFCLTSVMLAFGGLWSVPWLITAYDMPAASASLLTSTMFVGWLFGSPFAGWLSDRILSRKRILFSGAMTSLISFTAIILLPNLSKPILTSLYLLNGIGSSCMVICFGLVREWNTPKGSATAIGFANMCIVGSGALLQPLIGVMLDSRWQGTVVDDVRQYPAEAYEESFYILILALVLANFLILLLKETHCQQQVSD